MPRRTISIIIYSSARFKKKIAEFQNFIVPLKETQTGKRPKTPDNRRSRNLRRRKL